MCVALGRSFQWSPTKPADKWNQRIHEVLTKASRQDKGSVNARMFEQMKTQISKMRTNGSVYPKSKLGKALTYLENNGSESTTYLSDEVCSIHSNSCE